MINNLNLLNELEFSKLLEILGKLTKKEKVQSIELSLTSSYSTVKNEYVIKTGKFHEDYYIKVRVLYEV